MPRQTDKKTKKKTPWRWRRNKKVAALRAEREQRVDQDCVVSVGAPKE